MDMKTERNESELTIYFNGSLDTNTAPEFEELLHNSLEGVDYLILDLTNLEYISSAGLRAIFLAVQLLGKSEGLLLRNPNEDVYEIFEITGSTDLLHFEK